MCLQINIMLNTSLRRYIVNTSWVVVVTPADRPKSVRNRCAIEVFGGFFCVGTLLFEFSVVFGAVVIELSQIASFFLT